MTREEREELLEAWVTERSHLVGMQGRLDQLTVREREVLAHLMRGRTVREIATVGVVSEATVRTQVKAILAKLDVSSQIAAVGLAHQVGWRPPQLAV
jgi:DNA-binding NarL/FixJ family response regulator